MDVSVLIPTFQRTELLCACVGALARQATGARYEVVVGFDGPDAVGRASVERAWTEAGGRAGELVVLECERRGYTFVREKLIAAARGRVMISLNDDVVGDARLVEAHWLAHEEARAGERGRVVVIVGDAPYARRGERPGGAAGVVRESLLDRMVRETGMVFFYDQMNTPEGQADRERDWGFRHCFGLNFSMEMRVVREAGGVLAMAHTYGYDDIELAYRVCTRFGAPVLYRPEARVVHYHWYTPRDLMVRERSLGEAAWRFAKANPAFGMACFGRDIRSKDEVEYSRAFVERERASAERVRAGFDKLGEMAADAVGEGPQARAMLDVLVQQHLLLKRWEWRSGLLQAAGAA